MERRWIHAFLKVNCRQPYSGIELRSPIPFPTVITVILSAPYGGARGIMVIIIRNRHGDPSSNSEQGYLHFHIVLILMGNT